jgi:hypothetical protein
MHCGTCLAGSPVPRQIVAPDIELIPGSSVKDQFARHFCWKALKFSNELFVCAR